MSDQPSSTKPSSHHRSAAVIQNPSPLSLLPAASPPREYRKGNWTLHETLVLITAKRLDDERRKSPSNGQQNSRSAEQRWKWVENYCWTHQCYRSQNQCNDKWDNLLRDYKKVRDYDAKKSPSSFSYWSMEKQARKERNLPSNLAKEVFDALADVLARRNAVKTPTASALPLRQPSISELSSSSEEEGSEENDEEREESSEGKRRREGDVGASVVRGASVLARALAACEERRSKRHKQLQELEERRIRAEEHRAEVHRQGLAGLVEAVNNLVGAVNALVSRQESRR